MTIAVARLLPATTRDLQPRPDDVLLCESGYAQSVNMIWSISPESVSTAPPPVSHTPWREQGENDYKLSVWTNDGQEGAEQAPLSKADKYASKSDHYDISPAFDNT